MLTYRDFVLVADDVKLAQRRGGGGVRAFRVAVFDSPVGQSTHETEVKVPGWLVDELAALEDKTLNADLRRQGSLGLALGDMLLPKGDVREMYRRSLARLHPGTEGLRIRLRCEPSASGAAALAAIPWEFAAVPDADASPVGPQHFLALDARVSIVRHEALPVPADWFDAPGKRRVVVAAASPRPYDEYPRLEHLSRERDLINAALAKVKGAEAMLLPFRDPGDGHPGEGTTVAQLAKALTADPVDVLHFMGHGQWDEDRGQGKLIFADQHNDCQEVWDQRLAELIKAQTLHGRGVRLVVLDACQSGARSHRHAASGIAPALLAAGVPAVLAMQHSVDDRLASAFVGAFYAALVAGATIDEAVFRGRAAMRVGAVTGAADVRDWGRPVLYLRSPHGVVFNPVSDADAVKQAEAGAAHLVKQVIQAVEKDAKAIGAIVRDPKQSVEVKSEIKRVGGFVVGAVAFNNQGGRLTVEQNVDVVEKGGSLIGAVLSGSPGDDSPGGQLDALAQLQAHLMSPPAKAKRAKSAPRAARGDRPRARGSFRRSHGDDA